MNHPTREEWMSYLYGELSAGARANLTTHLQACPDCSTAVNGWQMARKHLDAWQLAPRKAKQVPVLLFWPALKWAVGAVIILSIGFGVGRLTSASTEVERVRAAIAPEIRQQLRQEFAQLLRDELNKAASTALTASGEQTEELLASYNSALEAKQAAEHQAFYADLDRLESQHAADYVSLKKELDTVAVNTDAGLLQTEQQLVQLADYTLPANLSNPPQK